MPPKGYRHLSVKEEVYRRLEEFARSKGLTSVSDALVLLLDFSDIYSKLEYILQKGVSNLLQTGVNQSQSPIDTSVRSNPNNPKHYILCLSPQEVKKIRNFEAYKVWVDKNFTLHRWWREEDGRVCFETSKPVKFGREVGVGTTAVGDVVEEVG